MTFEKGFIDTERAASGAIKVVALLAGALKQLQKAAVEGDLHKIRKTSERLITMLESAKQDILNARSAWPFNPDEEEQYLRDSYSREIIEAAKLEGLQIQERDEGLVIFPSILRMLPTERAVKLNRKKVSALRPSHLIKVLKAAQAKKPKATPELFLEVLYRTYRLLAANELGKTITLTSVYEALTLLPGSATNYDQTDFVRDLFLLDRSGVTRTKSGMICALPASTGTKANKGTFSFIAPDGETISYYGIRFSEVQG